MTQGDIAVERAIRAPADLVWAALADTNRCDRALGLSSPRYAWQEVEGRRCLVGNAKQGGASLSWIEDPYEWIEGRLLIGKRTFLTGPARDGGIRVQVDEALQGCIAKMSVSGEARSWVLRALSPVIAVALRKRLRDYIDAAAELLEGATSSTAADAGSPAVSRIQTLALASTASRPATPPPTFDRGELQQRGKRLQDATVEPESARRLLELLATRPDEDIAQMKPFDLARAWKLPRRDVLRCFLYATQAGLVDLNWQINCPVCKVSAGVATALGEVGRDVHCESCNIRYAVTFGDDVEAVFRCNAAIREVHPTVYCASSPIFRPHVIAQLKATAKDTRSEPLDLSCCSVRVRTLGSQTPAVFEAEAAPAVLHVTLRGKSIQLEAKGTAQPGTQTQVELTSELDEPAYVVFERAGWAADAVLGSVVASMAEFMDLFATEAPAAGLELSIGRLVLLFSDLTGSTALYTKIGDARAYAIVQEHFAVMQRVIAKHGGALVKTMGDAVMATFDSVPAAVEAALEAITETTSAHADLGIGIKLGIHEGACLAVRANDRLDFFGTTVNLAARLQGQAKTSELVLLAETVQQPKVEQLLAKYPRRSFRTELKGIAGTPELLAFDLGI